MAVRLEKETGDLVVDRFEQGIQPSPHKGIANIQNANISTETGEVVNSFARVQDTMTDTTATGTLAFVDTSHVSLSIANTDNLFKGNWIAVTGSSNTGELPNGTYYVPPSTGANFQLANYYNAGIYLPASGTVNYLIVAGGGGGGGENGNGDGGGGGGGGGQVKTGSTTAVGSTAYTITIGAGGAGGNASNGLVGVDSSAFSITSTHGTGGVFHSNAAGDGGTSGSGHTGFAASGSSGGGGGGDSANATTQNGGTGTSSSLSGSSVAYGGGGGGGGFSVAGTGTSGGGNGATGGSNGGNATANTGGGGGGPGDTATTGGNGAAGLVIISAAIGLINVSATTGGTHTTSGGNDIWTFTTSGTWTPVYNTVTPPSVITGFTTGLTATIQMVATMGKPLASATETYRLNGTVYNRYYVLDNQNRVWVYDTQNETTYISTDNVSWFLPDFQTNWCTSASGIAVINGFLVAAAESGLYGKSVALLGNTNSTATAWTQFNDVTGWNGATSSTTIPHFCYVGHQGNLYITDANYIANVFPDSTLASASSTNDNVQSFCLVTPISTNEGTYSIISGTSPVTSDGKRLPVVFFTENGGILPTSITAGTVYYISANDAALEIFSAPTGGSALDPMTGQLGSLYFNSFYPIAAASAYDGATPTYIFTNQRLTLPNFEIAQCMAEIGNLIVIGCLDNVVYPWDQIQNLPSNIISLPEANVQYILTVHNMAYIFMGNKGNIAITDGSVASAVITVPDYCAGVPGTPSSYIEPVFQWGGVMYLRSRVYFSILDQTSIKAGNCGGIWSFTPTQSLYIGQDVGVALRLENQSSYGTYSGYAPILIPKMNQNAVAPQYFSAWESDVNTPTYGIDATGTTFSPTAIIESDAIPTGTMLNKQTFEQIEFKLSSPLQTGDTVTLFYRKNLTDAWKSLGPVQLQEDKLSGYVSANFEKSQWLQTRTLLNASSSFIRMVEQRIR